MSSQKYEERKILEQAYKKEVIENSTSGSETPDFIITDRVNSKKIGVEVTTIYSSKAGALSVSAKFAKTFIEKNKPGKTQQKRKPKFLKNFGVAEIKGAQGAFHDDYVIYELNCLNEYLQFFEDIIKKKSESYNRNPKNVEFVNLVAKDKSPILWGSKYNVGQLYELYRQHSIFDTIIQSNFQEIYLITTFKSGLFNIPLKWYIFTSEYFLFNKFWQDSSLVHASKKNDIVNKVNNFIIMLIHLGFNKIYLHREKHIRYIFFGNNYFIFDTEKKTIDEKSFLAIELSKFLQAKEVFKSYQDYYGLFVRYQDFRKTLVPKLPEGMFRKLS